MVSLPRLLVYILVIPLAGGMLSRHHLQHGFQRRFGSVFVFLSILVLFTLSQAATFNLWQLGLCSLFLLVFPAMAALAIILICAFAVPQNQAQIREMGGMIMSLMILLNALGYLVGWDFAKLYRFDHNHRIPLAIEIGMQNVGMGVTLALAHFRDQPEVALPGALFAVWCILTAAGASAHFRRKSALVKA